MRHKIFTSLIKPPMPLGLTQSYIMFLMIAAAIPLPFVFIVSPYLLVTDIVLISGLFFLGKRRLKKDWQYFDVIYGIWQKDGFRLFIKKEFYRK